MHIFITNLKYNLKYSPNKIKNISIYFKQFQKYMPNIPDKYVIELFHSQYYLNLNSNYIFHD